MRVRRDFDRHPVACLPHVSSEERLRLCALGPGARFYRVFPKILTRRILCFNFRNVIMRERPRPLLYLKRERGRSLRGILVRVGISVLPEKGRAKLAMDIVAR